MDGLGRNLGGALRRLRPSATLAAAAALGLGVGIGVGVLGSGEAGADGSGEAGAVDSNEAGVLDSGAVTPARARRPNTVHARITDFVDRAMEELDLVPGLSLAIVRGEEIVYERGFGWASLERREPVTPYTIFGERLEPAKGGSPR